MSHYPELVHRHRRSGILIDSTVLVVYIVGSVDPTRIEQFKRTREYRTEDFEILSNFLDPFAVYLSTPNILTEVSNLLKGRTSQESQNYQAALAKFTSVTQEQYLPSLTVMASTSFVRLGLADTGIVDLAMRSGVLVLTDDTALAAHLYHQNLDVINFTHLRGLDA